MYGCLEYAESAQYVLHMGATLQFIGTTQTYELSCYQVGRSILEIVILQHLKQYAEWGGNINLP